MTLDEIIKLYPAVAKGLEGWEELPVFDQEFADSLAPGFVKMTIEYLKVPENMEYYKRWKRNKDRREKRQQAKKSKGKQKKK